MWSRPSSPCLDLATRASDGGPEPIGKPDVTTVAADRPGLSPTDTVTATSAIPPMVASANRASLPRKRNGSAGAPETGSVKGVLEPRPAKPFVPKQASRPPGLPDPHGPVRLAEKASRAFERMAGGLSRRCPATPPMASEA